MTRVSGKKLQVYSRAAMRNKAGLRLLAGPDSYPSGSVSTGSVCHAGQVKSDDPDKKGYVSPPGWGLGVRPTTSPRKKIYVEKT
jgi:hypothetical protein